ncbi:hypothetical protein J7K43_02300 [Candidatus Calescamantes bacterium]|nr:hypothetical protein [Candidatus Calescamantes bacterium]
MKGKEKIKAFKEEFRKLTPRDNGVPCWNKIIQNVNKLAEDLNVKSITFEELCGLDCKRFREITFPQSWEGWRNPYGHIKNCLIYLLALKHDIDNDINYHSTLFGADPEVPVFHELKRNDGQGGKNAGKIKEED